MINLLITGELCRKFCYFFMCENALLVKNSKPIILKNDDENLSTVINYTHYKLAITKKNLVGR